MFPDLRRRLALLFSSQLPLAFPARKSPDMVAWFEHTTGVLSLVSEALVEVRSVPPAPSVGSPSEAKMAIFSRTCPGLITVQISSGASASSMVVWYSLSVSFSQPGTVGSCCRATTGDAFSRSDATLLLMLLFVALLRRSVLVEMTLNGRRLLLLLPWLLLQVLSSAPCWLTNRLLRWDV